MPSRYYIFSTRPVSVMLTAINVIMSLIGLRYFRLYQQWILHPFGVTRRKEYYRLFLSGFVHNDFPHLFINCVMIIFICGEQEVLLNKGTPNGSINLLIIYLFSQISGALAVTWINRNNYEYSSAGASGAVIGCMMSFMILSPHETAFYLPVIGSVANQYAALIVIVGLIIYKWRSGNELLDNELHFFSALGGIAATLMLYPHLL